MKNLLARLPILVLLSGAAGVGMFGPAIVAFRARDWGSAQSFFYSGLLVLIIVVLIAVATKDQKGETRTHMQLVSLFLAFLLLPVVLAVPLYESVGNTLFLNAYFEMVSSITTTGATVYDPARLTSAEHLWRGLVAWSGGLLMWSAALALFSPLNVGGFELASKSTAASGIIRDGGVLWRPSERLVRSVAQMTPIYGGLTLLLAVVLMVAGDRPLVAAMHAMATMATSGVSPVGGVENAVSGRVGEVMVAIFLIFAVARTTFGSSVLAGGETLNTRDPELRLAFGIVVLISLGLYGRHFAAAVQAEEADQTLQAITAMWGTVFTVFSFLTTTGFASADWEAARSWSGLEAPGLILTGLALVGGGVATTAGGIKLLRVYALIKHGQREVGRLVHPSSVGGAGRLARHIRREGAFIAWVVFMLLMISIAVIMLALSAAGTSFDDALVLTVASLTNTGPLADFAAKAPISYANLTPASKLVLAFAMAMGRVETLTLVALLNPNFWRS